MKGHFERHNPRPPAPRRLGPGLDAGGQQRLDPGADRLAEHRRGAVRRNADDERRAIDHGAELKIAEGRIVDRVHRHAGRLRGSLKGGGLLVRVGIDEGDSGAAQVIRLPPALDEPGTWAPCKEAAHGLARLGRDHVELCTRGVQQLRLPHRALGGAGQHDALARKGEENGQNR